MNEYFKIAKLQTNDFTTGKSQAHYCILLIDQDAEFSVDLTDYKSMGQSLLFLSPFQHFQWNGKNTPELTAIHFHGDFYCIEFHKEDVACNGILFNNIYQNPFFHVKDSTYSEIQNIVSKINQFSEASKSYDIAIVKSYLQLLLALSSREKQLIQSIENLSEHFPSNLSNFQQILDQQFIANRSVQHYAQYYGMTVDAFSKNIKRIFKKTPSKLIQERLVLEAKKLLHLSYLNIKEISAKLNFKDEFHFSRYFKKEVGLSLKVFRDKVGISIAAKIDMI